MIGPVVVIEGVDRTGKTTLARELHDIFLRTHGSCAAVHHSKPEAHPIVEYEASLIGRGPFSGDHCGPLVLDRAHVGELVWPHIFGRESDMDTASYRHIEMTLLSRGALLVLAHRPDIREAIAAAPDEPINAQQAEIASIMFEAMVEGGALPVLKWQHTPRTATAEDIAEAASSMYEAALRPLTVDDGWIGDPQPRALIVGVELYRGAWPLPFAPLPMLGANRYLLEHIDKAPDLDWRRFALAHSRSVSPALVKEMGNPPVVALGKVSAAELRARDVACAEIDHPAIRPPDIGKQIADAVRL